MNYNNTVISTSVAEMKTEMPTDKYLMVLIGDNPDPTEGKARFYMFDYTSTATPDNDVYIVPNFPQFTAQGRWVKIVLPDVQQNTNWNSSSGVTQLLNKPTLATVATTGQYSDLSGKPSPYTYVVAGPTSRTVVLGTAYQSLDNTKPSIQTITLTSSASLTLGGGTVLSADLVIGATSAVSGGTGFILSKYLNSLTGTLVVGVAINNGQTVAYTLPIPTGWYFAVRNTGAAGITVVSTFDQALG